ncbi:hypothetical protein V6N13_004428 [Hibiscus sabdariffa]|uniref:Uncharacterized protein n=1 Tax=Hibiscus sabdariffa TaxID=183260 RepID=A0ABR2RZ09_9ROSI
MANPGISTSVAAAQHELEQVPTMNNDRFIPNAIGTKNLGVSSQPEVPNYSSKKKGPNEKYRQPRDEQKTDSEQSMMEYPTS